MNKETFFNLSRTTQVDLGDGNSVTVREASAKFLLDLQAQHEGDPITQAVKLALECCLDDDGNPLFTADDVPQLESMPMRLVEKIVEGAINMSLEDAKKKLAPTT